MCGQRCYVRWGTPPWGVSISKHFKSFADLYIETLMSARQGLYQDRCEDISPPAGFSRQRTCTRCTSEALRFAVWMQSFAMWVAPPESVSLTPTSFFARFWSKMRKKAPIAVHNSSSGNGFMNNPGKSDFFTPSDMHPFWTCTLFCHANTLYSIRNLGHRIRDRLKRQ